MFIIKALNDHFSIKIVFSYEISPSVIENVIHVKVLSEVEHSSANPKVSSSILGPVSYRGHGYIEARFMHLTPGVVSNYPKAVGI